MCGIAGIVGTLSPDETSSRVELMTRAQTHRGPDDEGISVMSSPMGSVGLGLRRLAILDLSPLGHQPMKNAETGDVITYNGEIYNFQDLRHELEAAGYNFRGRSDTEVLLRGYQKWGVGLLDRLRGMFAFALWDAHRQRLLLARDHFGIKPLYYAALPHRGFVCASEIRAILASGLVTFEIDQRALAGYLAYGAVQEPLTILKNVFALPAGTWMEVNASGETISLDSYWKIPAPVAQTNGTRPESVMEEGRELLERAVKRHLISDVPLGVFLSSGLDSTAIAGLTQRTAPDQVHAFTVSFPDDPKLDESPVAHQTAQRLGLIYHDYPVDTATALDWAVQGLDCMDQPAMDGLNTYIVSRAVREQGIVVALSGQGGDEVFGGYRSFRGVPRWSRRMDWLNWVGPEMRAALIGLAASTKGSVARKKAQDIARNGSDLLGIFFHYRRLMSDEDLMRLGFSCSELNLSSSFHVPSLATDSYLVADDPVASVGRLESVFYLGNTLLRDGDVFGMANSLEIRVPFLDRDLIEWSFKLPGNVLLPSGAEDKHLLRQMCEEFYSREQLQQAKRGFTPPLSLWMLGPLRDVMNESLSSLKGSGLMSVKGVDLLQRVFLREPHTAAWSRIWSLVALGHWISKFNAVSSTISTRVDIDEHGRRESA